MLSFLDSIRIVFTEQLNDNFLDFLSEWAVRHIPLAMRVDFDSIANSPRVICDSGDRL